MKKVLQLGLTVSSLSASLYAGNTIINNLGVTPGDFPYQKKVTIQVTNNDGNPLINGAIQMNPNNNMYMYAMDLSNISEGKYTVSVRHNNDCNEEAIYHETIVLRALRTQDNISNNVISIPIDFDCMNHDNNEFHFETEHPYSNNTHMLAEFPPSCTGNDYSGLFVLEVRGETEKNYDFLTIFQDDNLIAQLDGNIHETLEIDCTLPTTIFFDSDYSVTKSGVTVDLVPEMLTSEVLPEN